MLIIFCVFHSLKYPLSFWIVTEKIFNSLLDFFVMKKEVIVIGCGPAGLSAAIYLGRAKIDTLVVGKLKESQVMKAHVIMNYFGFPEGIAGKELLQRGLKQAKKYGVSFLQREVVNVTKKGEWFAVKTDTQKEYYSKAVIIATGTPIILTGIENEESLTGKGVHYCVECDGAFYQKKNVAVIGSGNHAAEEAISLLTYTKHITLVANADRITFSSKFLHELQKRKITIVSGAVKAFVGTDHLDSITFMDGRKMKFDGVFMGCGELSAMDFASKLALDTEKEMLKVDKNGMTSEQGVFAAGNCISRCRQVAKSVGDGCNAALSAIKFLRNKELYQDYST